MTGQRQRPTTRSKGERQADTSVAEVAAPTAHEHEGIVSNQALLRHLGVGAVSPPAPPVQAIARHGATGAGAPIPFRDQVRSSFGRHDVSHVRAFTGERATAAARALAARAFTSGTSVVFAGTPDLRTTAHELAHVVQQRGGVQLKGEVGEAGDVHERHADAVAERVVRGRSAEDLLDRYTSPHPPAGARPQIQLWGEPDHYAMGQRAGIKAVRVLDTIATTKERSYRLKEEEKDLSETRDYVQDPDIATKVKKVVVPSADKLMIRGPTGAAMSLGAANRFAGDFTKKPIESESAHPSPSLDDMPEAIHATEEEDRKKFERRAAVVGKDQAARETRVRKEYLGAGFFAEKTLMATNANHFFPLSTIEYRRQHATALQKAWVGRRLWADAEATEDHDEAVALKAQANEAFRQAVMVEGFAGHFLADCFAAGHLAPHALGRIGDKSPVTAGARVNTWHDLFNALPNGIPTTLGTFHGDYSMDGNDLEYVSGVIAESLLEVMYPWYDGRSYDGNVVTPAPDIAAIRSDPVAGPLWRTMCGDYDSFFEALKKSDGRKKGKMSLSKYIMYATSAGSGIAKGEILPMIARDVFGGDDGLERTDKLQDGAGIRGKVHSIVAALDQVLGWWGGLQKSTGLGQDYLPAGAHGPLKKKYLISLRSAQLATVSPTHNPRKALIEELTHWSFAWAGELKTRVVDPKERTLLAKVVKLRELLGDTAEKKRTLWHARINEVLKGFHELDSTLALPSPVTAPIEQVEQGPDVPRSPASSSGRAITATPGLLKIPGLDLGQVDEFMAAIQALLSDPRPRLDRDHEQLYDLLIASTKRFGAHVRAIYDHSVKHATPDIEIFSAAQTLSSFALGLRQLRSRGLTLVKTRKETFRRDTIKSVSEQLSTYFTVDADRLFATTGRVPI